MTQPFGGHFDGRGHTVTYSVTEAEKADGLFPYLKGTEEQAAEVRDLKVVVEEYSPKKDAAGGALVCRAEKSVISGVSVTLNKYTPPVGGDSAGGAGIVGTVAADAVIENCNVKAAAGDYRKFGGIAYENAGRIKNSEFLLLDGVSKLGNFGGIAHLTSGDLKNCRASVPYGTALAADANAFGGIAATLSGGSVTGCDAKTALSSGGDACAVGGVVGRVSGEAAVENSRSSGALITGKYAGGLIGSVEASAAEVRVSGCVSGVIELRAQVADAAAGGLIGIVNVGGKVSVTDCTSATNVAASTRGGGLVGCVDFVGSGALAFTMSECASTAEMVNVTGGYAGGAIGYVDGRNTQDTKAVLSVAGCEAYAECVAKEFAGGLVGGHDTSALPAASISAEYADCTAYGKTAAAQIAGGAFGCAYGAGVRILRCRASGDVAVQEIRGGGFVGDPTGKAESYLTIQKCSAEGTVTGLGGIGGFVGRADYTEFTGCNARGNVNLYGDAWEDGGFAGKMVDSNAADCISEGNVVCLVVSDVNREYLGGFTGSTLGNCEFRNCTAFGDVLGNTFLGGFTGVLFGGAVRATVSFTACKAYGNVLALTEQPEDYNYCGGFVGISGERGNANFTDCEAYGDVRGANAGGFASKVEVGIVSFKRCKAYGEVENLYNDNLPAGGFIGWIVGTESLTVSECASYGKVITLTDAVNFPETGGFIGWIAGILDGRIVIITNCHSYAPQIVGPPRTDSIVMGAFIGALYQAGVKVQNCTYTQGDVWPMVGVVYSNSTLNESGNAPNTVVPEILKPALSCSVTQPAGTDLNIAFTAVSEITGNVQELGVSLDGGQNYTLFVYRGMPLIALPGGDTVPAAPFAFKLKNTGHTGTAGVVVRITFTDGYTRALTF